MVNNDYIVGADFRDCGDGKIMKVAVVKIPKSSIHSDIWDKNVNIEFQFQFENVKGSMSGLVWAAGCPFLPSALPSRYSIVSNSFQQITLACT